MKQISSHNTKIYYLTQFLQSLIFIIPVVIVFYQQRFTPSQISMFYGLRFAVQFISELPTGALSDLLGKKASMIIGYALNATAYFMSPLLHSFSSLVLYAVLFGLSASFLSGSVEAMIYDSLKQNKKEKTFKKVVTRQAFYYQIGLAIGSLLGGFLYQVHQILPFYLTGILYTVSMILSFYIIEPAIDTEKFTLLNYLKQIRDGTKEVFKSSFISKLSSLYILVGGITWTVAIYFSKYIMVELEFSDIQRGIIQGGLRLLNIALLTKLLKNKKIFTKKVSIMFFPAIMIISFLPGKWLAGLFALPFIAGTMISSTARWIILGEQVNHEFDSKYRSTAISVLSMFVGLIYIVITMVSGPIIEHFDPFGVRTIYTIFGILAILLVLPLSISIVKDKSFVNNQ